MKIIDQACRTHARLWSLKTESVDRNGPCKSLKLGNFVDREIGAIWWWRGWIPPLRRSRGRRWRKRIGAEMMSSVVALSQRSCAPRLRGASRRRTGSRRVPQTRGCPIVVCGVRVVYNRISNEREGLTASCDRFLDLGLQWSTLAVGATR